MTARRSLQTTGVVLSVLAYGAEARADSVLLGTVLDAETRSPVADVVVTATSPGLQGEQVVVTDERGQYRLPQLPPGVYTLRFDKEAFRPFSRPDVVLRLDRTLRVNVELLPESASDSLTLDLQGEAPTLDVGSTATGLNVDQDFIRRIAVNRPGGRSGASRSFESLAELAPGAQNDAYGVSLNGATSPENGYVVDGLSTNDPAFGVNASPLSVEFVQDVNIITGGYMPEYGRSTGGILNAVTKSGSNEFHGSVYGTVTPGAFEAPRTQVVSASSVIAGRNALDVLGDVGATLGGPLLRDKLWFFAGLAPNFSHYTHTRSINAYQTELDASGQVVVKTDERGDPLFSEIPGSARRFQARSRSLQYLGKLTYLFDPNHHLSLSVSGTPTATGGRDTLPVSPLTGLVLPVMTGRPDAELFFTESRASTTSTALKYSGSSDDKRLLVDATLGWFHQTASMLPSDGSPVGAPTGLAGLAAVNYLAPRPLFFYEPELAGAREACTQNGETTGLVACPVYSYIAGGPGYINSARLDRVQANARTTWLTRALGGSHVLKLGADVEWLRYDNRKAYSGSVYLFEAADGSNWADVRRFGYLSGPDQATSLPFLHSVTHSSTAGGFLQDSFTLAQRVTINVGLRYDTQWLYGGDGKLAFVLPHELSPRLGVVVDPLANGRVKLYAHVARYYEQVPINVLDRAFPPEPRYLTKHSTGVGRCDPATLPTREGQATCLADSNLEPINGPAGPALADPSFLYAGGKADLAPVDPALQPQSSDELLVGAEYELLTRVRLGATYTHRSMNLIIEDMSRDGGNSRILGNPGVGFARDFPRGVRDYDAVTVFLERTFGDGWLAQASYTWSRLYGNYSGLFRPETLQLDPNFNSDFDLITLTVNREGLLPFDRPHVLKLFGAREFQLTPGLSANLGLSYRGNSGIPISYLGAHPLYGQNEAFILARGSAGRTPWVNNVDTNVGVNLRVNRNQVLSLSVDVFNLFNFQQATTVDEAYTFQSVLPIPGGQPAGGRLTPEQVTALDPATGLPAGPLSAEALNKNFKQPTSYQSPRQLRLGLRYTF